MKVRTPPNLATANGGKIIKEEYYHFRKCGMPHIYTVCHLGKVYQLGEFQVEQIIGIYTQNTPFHSLAKELESYGN